MPKLEDLHKEWAALSRADLSFPISFLFRFQAKPNPAAEHCEDIFEMKAMHLYFVQRMPATQCPYVGEPREVISFCDASWGLDSVSGAIIIYRGVASNSFQGSRRFQLYHLLRLKSFPLLKQPRKWCPLECCCKQLFRESPLIL